MHAPRAPRQFALRKRVASNKEVKPEEQSGAENEAPAEAAKEDVPDRKRRKMQKGGKDAKQEPFSVIRARIAAWASKVTAAPEANIGVLKELRQFSASHKGRAAALSILTEAQLFQDIAPAYRIRTISETEASVSVSKDVAKLRAFEQALLAAYRRFVKSVVALSRWRSGASKTMPTTKATDQMIRVRRASCTALSSLLRALPHFNDVDTLVAAVVGLVADREEDVRKEAAASLKSVLGDAHRAAGPALEACVTIAQALSRAAHVRAAGVSAETIEPLLGIRFASFPKLPIGKGDGGKRGNFKGKNAKVNSRKAAKAAKEESEKAKRDRETEAEVMRDLREANAEATPQELYAARKALLDAVCRALFNVIQAASLSSVKATFSDSSRSRKPPQALAAALHGLLRVAEFISVDIVEAIVAALGPLLSGRLPIMTKLRCLCAAYAILAHHAHATRTDPDALTADARGMDSALYACLGGLFGQEAALAGAEAHAIETTRAVASALAFRDLPVARASALARRAAVSAAALSPTHAAALSLLAAVQFLAPRRLVSSVFAGPDGAVTDAAEAEFLQRYDAEIEDPDATGAEHSAMWEMAAVAAHYHPVVEKVARSIVTGAVEPLLVGSCSDVPAMSKRYSTEGGGFNPPPKPEMPAGTLRERRLLRTDEEALAAIDENPKLLRTETAAVFKMGVACDHGP